ncbi:MAG: recombination protein O N-terminal domain-containing protein [Bacteroidales bacterium]|nr:recombination protein O N-terminal domain-containing protein [Bacteroidales bacterium]
MTVNTDLIVLHTTRFGENSTVVHTLSKEYGRRSFLVRGVGKKAMTTLFLPLTVLEADVVETNKSTLYTAKNLAAKYPLLGIRDSRFKNPMTMFMSEVLYRVVKEGGCEPGLFEWCEKSVLMLDAIQSDFSNFHIRFLLELAVALGFSPEAHDLMPFVGTHYPIVERFMRESFAETMLIPLSGAVRNEIAEEILRYIEFHSESTLNINSLKVLRALFA